MSVPGSSAGARSLAIGLLMLLAATSGQAAERVEKSTVLGIDVVRGVIVQTPGNSETPIADANTFTTRRNVTIRVDILRQNPLLFTYEATNAKSDTAEYAAALEFAKQLQALLALFPSSSGSGIRQATIGGVDLDQLQKDLDLVRSLFGSLGGDLAASMGAPPQVEALKKKYSDANVDALVKRIEAALSAIAAIVNSCEQPDAALSTDGGAAVSCDGPVAIGLNAALTARVAEYHAREAQVQRLQASVDDTVRSLAAAKADAEKAKGKADQAGKADVVKNLEKRLAGLRAAHDMGEEEVQSALADLKKDRSDLKAQLHPTLLEFARRVEATATLVLRQLDTLKAASADVASLDTPRAVITAPYGIQRQTITVSIGQQSKYDAFLDSDTRRKRDARLRKVTVVLEPYQPAHLSLAPAFVLGFLRNPEFAAVKDGATFRIQKKESELGRYTAGIMLNITPDGWQEPTFGGHLQVGISPAKDALGFFFGAGIRAQNLFSFGAGLMLQQVRKLGGDLTLDTRLDDPAKLTIAHEFKPGLYLHVTATLPK